MKKVIVGMMVLAAFSFASMVSAKDCPGMKGKDGAKCNWVKDAKDVKVEGEVVKVEKDAKSDKKCEMVTATIKTAKGEEKVLLCSMAGEKNDVKVGDKVSLSGKMATCKVDGKDSKMICAKEGTCNGKAMKMMGMKDGKKGKCPYMAGEKKKDDKKTEIKK